MVVDPHLFGLDIHRLLLAAVGTVANQAFANDVSRHVDDCDSGAEGLQIFDDRGLRGVTRLQIEAAQRNDRQQSADERQLRRTPQREDGGSQRNR